MRLNRESAELVQRTLVGADWQLIGDKRGAVRLGFALLVKFFAVVGRFPENPGEISDAVLGYLAAQVRVDARALADYPLTGSVAGRHRQEIRDAIGESPDHRVRWRWQGHWESRAPEGSWEQARRRPAMPPEPVNPETRMLRRPTGRIDLISTRPKGSQACRRVVAGLGGSQAADLDALTSDSANAWLLDELWSGVPRCDPETLARDLDTVAAMRTLGLDGASEPCEEPVRDTLGALTRETDTVRMLRALNLPDELFDHIPRNQFTAWRAQAMRIPPGELSAEPYEVRLTLLAVRCRQRQQDSTEALAGLLIDLVERLESRFEHQVAAESVESADSVPENVGLLHRLAEAALAYPDHPVREAIYPAVGGRALSRLIRDGNRARRARQDRCARRALRRTYCSAYRQVLTRILSALELRCSHPASWPITVALDQLVDEDTAMGESRFFESGSRVPIQGVLRREWRSAVVDGRGRIERVPYELCLLMSLRDAVCAGTIHVAGCRAETRFEQDRPAGCGRAAVSGNAFAWPNVDWDRR